MSNLVLLAEVWSVIKDSISTSERDGVADTIVSLLIDHDISPDDIKRAFRGDDGGILDALKFYAEAAESDEFTYDDDQDEEFDYSFEDDNDGDEEDQW